MAADNGDWIKLYRKTLDSCVASDDWLCRLWVQLLLRANWKPSWFAGTQIEVGQLAFSQGNLAAELKVHRSTLTRGLKKLSDLGQITVSNANNRFSVVTICNWETYQNGKQAVETTAATTAATTGEQLANNCATTAATHPKKERILRREEGKNISSVPNQSETEQQGAVVMVFPTKGKSKTWELRQSLVDTLKDAFPDLDLPQQFRKARAWCEANPAKQKTPRGMAKFLWGWLERSQNDSRGSPFGPSKPQQKFTPWNPQVKK